MTNRDVPDVLGFADYKAAPDVTHGLAKQRLADASAFLDAQSFPLPKANGATRGITVLNPIDELLLRTFVGRCSRAILDATDTERVLNGIIRRPGPGWISADFRDQSRQRRNLRTALYNHPETNAVGFFDVKDFFKSCGHDELAAILIACGAPVGAVARLVGLLGDLFSSGVGLPIGFEGSGPLANLFLAAVDADLPAHSVGFVRWTDDVDVFLRSPDDWPAVHELVRSRLAAVSLCLNDSKVAMFEKGPAAEHRLLDPSRDSFLDGDPVDNVESRFETELWARDWGINEEMPAAHFRSRLGYLRTKAHPGAVNYLANTPAWVDREPKSVGNYLSAIARDGAARKMLDRDWLIDLAVGRVPTKDTAAGQLHLCRVLADYAPDKGAGKRLLEFAYSAPVFRSYAALGSWAVRGWSASRGWQRSDFGEILNSVGHLSYQRAAVAGLLRRGGSDAARAEAFARINPALRPAIHWATST